MFLPKYSPDLNPIEQVFATKPCCERPEREATKPFPKPAPETYRFLNDITAPGARLPALIRRRPVPVNT